jgi:putative ABC transport system ATP-binding protein
MSAFKSTQEIIRLEQISKHYGQGDLKVLALHNINLLVNQGEYCAIMGASGSGKSTTMQILGCLDRPSSGRYYLQREAVDSLSDDNLAYIRNRKLGFVFQQFHLLSQLTAMETVMLPMTYAGLPQKESGIRRANVLSPHPTFGWSTTTSSDRQSDRQSTNLTLSRRTNGGFRLPY